MSATSGVCRRLNGVGSSLDPRPACERRGAFLVQRALRFGMDPRRRQRRPRPDRDDRLRSVDLAVEHLAERFAGQQIDIEPGVDAVPRRAQKPAHASARVRLRIGNENVGHGPRPWAARNAPAHRIADQAGKKSGYAPGRPVCGAAAAGALFGGWWRVPPPLTPPRQGEGDLVALVAAVCRHRQAALGVGAHLVEGGLVRALTCSP